MNERVDRIALVAATFPFLVYGIGGNYELPSPLHFGALAIAGIGLAAAFARQRWAGMLILGGALAFGVYDRAMTGDNRASDVMLTTNEALGVLASGANPYAHTYAMTNPPGGLFGYPPGEIAFYGAAHLLGADVFRVDRMASIIIFGLVVCLAPIVGEGLAALAVSTLALAGDLTFHATDGSNDTAASALVLGGLVALAWSQSGRGRAATACWWLSAVAFGWAVAFKEYALPIGLFVGLYLWRADARRARGWTIAAAATAALFVLPFLVWNPVALVSNVGGALLVHHNVWGRNLWHDLVSALPIDTADAIAPFIPAIMLAVVIGEGTLLWRRPARTLGMAFLQGCAIVATIFVLARWTTSVYYVFLAPLIVAGAALALGADEGEARAETAAAQGG